MYLSKISGRQLKGGDFDIPLTRANVLFGENFAGKTRIADAVRLLLVGYLPELGKLPRATFGLASGTSMEVSGIISDGLVDYSLSRRWWLDGDTVKSAVEMPDKLKSCSLLTVMLNAEEYFALSDRARVDYVFANIGMGEVTPDKLRARLLAALHDADKKFVVPIMTKIEDALAEEAKECPVITAQVWCDEALKAVTEFWKRSKDWKKTMDSTVQGLTGLRAADDKFRPVAEAMDERARVERTITNLAEAKGGKMQAFTAQRGAKVRREAIARELTFSEKDAHELIGLEAKLGLLVAEIDALPVAVGSIGDYNVKVSGLTAAHQAAELALQQVNARLRACAEELDEMKGRSSCPYCGTCGDNWKETRMDELTIKMVEIEKERAAAMLAAEGTFERRMAAEEERDSAKVIIEKAEALRYQCGQIRTQVATIKPRLARADALREELARLPEDDPLLMKSVDDLQAEENLRRAELRSLDEEIAQANGRAQEITRLAQAEADRDNAEKAQSTAERAGKLIREMQSDLVEQAFAPLLETANAIFGAVLKTPLAYHDGEIGTRRDGVWVGHRTFSGTEKALTYAAIQAALAAKSPIRVMLLDELGRLTANNAELTAAAALNAVAAGHIDQFLGIDPERPGIYRNIAGPGTVSPFTVLEIR